MAIFAVCSALAADFHPPAGNNYAQWAPAGAILPGGRLIKPLGVQIETGPGPFGLAVSPRGTVATADTGAERFGVTFIEPPTKRNAWQVGHIWARAPHSQVAEFAPPDWRGVTAGIAFDGEKSVWVTEGDSGRIRQLELSNGDHGKIVSLNGADWSNSFTVDLAYNNVQRLFYVVDQTNARVAVVERTGRVMSSVRLEKSPFAIALSPDGMMAYVTEADAVCAIDVHDPMKPAVARRIPAPAPEAVLATADRVYVTSARNDSISVISPGDGTVVARIVPAIPSLEQFRGVMPAGMAWDPVNKWLLVAEAGINAVGVLDTATNGLIAHIPVGWMPTRVAISGDRVYVANARGRGSGPNPRRTIYQLGETPLLDPGSVSTFIMPARSELPNLTGLVYSLNGFLPYTKDEPKAPAAIRHVVLIVKSGRTFDEVMGDAGEAGEGRAMSMPKMARFGMHGYADGGKTRFSVHDAPMTPNQHAIARRWAFSDNFYAAGETKAEGEYWLNGGYPDLVVESAIRASRDAPPATAFRDHLKQGGVTFARVDWQKGGAIELKKLGALPQLLRIDLPDDRKDPDPEHGYPYEATYVAENDFAAGKIVDYLSHSPEWRDMVVFITETDTEGGLDHVDAHRTLLFAAGPYVKRGYASHTNSGVSGLMRTIYALLRLPPDNLMDRTAAGLWDLFTEEPDLTPFNAVLPDSRIFDHANRGN